MLYQICLRGWRLSCPHPLPPAALWRRLRNARRCCSQRCCSRRRVPAGRGGTRPVVAALAPPSPREGKGAGGMRTPTATPTITIQPDVVIDKAWGLAIIPLLLYAYPRDRGTQEHRSPGGGVGRGTEPWKRMPRMRSRPRRGNEIVMEPDENRAWSRLSERADDGVARSV